MLLSLLFLASASMVCGISSFSPQFVPAGQGQGQPRQTIDVVSAAHLLQSVGHLAVVDVFSPLQVALSALDSQWGKLQLSAAQRRVNIPMVSVPKEVDLAGVLTCRARSDQRYTGSLRFLLAKEREIEGLVDNATRLSSGIQYASQLVINDQIEQGTLQALTTRLNKFLAEFSSLLSGFESAVCNNNYEPRLLNELQNEQIECLDGDCKEKRRFCPRGTCVDGGE